MPIPAYGPAYISVLAGASIAPGDFVRRTPEGTVVSTPDVRDVHGIATHAASRGELVHIQISGYVEPGAYDQVPYSSLPPGSICEQCFDAPAIALQAAPWGGDMGVCAACGGGITDEGETANRTLTHVSAPIDNGTEDSTVVPYVVSTVDLSEINMPPLNFVFAMAEDGTVTLADVQCGGTPPFIDAAMS